MNITVFGASGLTGRPFVDQALEAGHRVKAVVRDPARFPVEHERLEIATADLTGDDRLEPIVDGADAVVACLGHRPKEPGGMSIVSTGTRRIADAMSAAGVKRLLLYTAGPIETTPSPGRPDPPKHDPGQGVFARYLLTPLVKRLFGAGFVDLAEAEDVLRDSTLDYTVFRPPRLLTKPLTGHYRTSVDRTLRRGLSISRADLAHALLSAIDDPATVRRWVSVAY